MYTSQSRRRKLLTRRRPSKQLKSEPPGSSSRMTCKSPSPSLMVTTDSSAKTSSSSPLKTSSSSSSSPCSRRSNSVSVNGTRSRNHLSVDATISGTHMADQLNSWYKQRNKKSSEIDVTRCGEIDVVDPVKTEALEHAALRLRNLVHSLDKGDVSPRLVLQKNLEYAISVMESSYLKRSSRIDSRESSSDEEMLEGLSSELPVPHEIKNWLVETFSKTKVVSEKKRSADRRSLRSVVHAVQAGMFVDRIYRKYPNEPAQHLPPDVEAHLKDLDKWNFNVFELEKISGGNSLKYVCYQLLTKFDLIQKFKIPAQALLAYCNKLQQGYRMHENQYHNPIHAADVAQTLNCFLVHSSFSEWMTDLEIFSMIMAAIVHDLEHTGTTNNFHINTRSSLAVLYNDKSVLENHHISTAFRLLQEEGCDMMCNFSKEDFQECRTLMIEMVLATDMVQHYSQVKHMKEMLKNPQYLEKSKAMAFMIHAADINHPAKQWPLHYKWTERLVVEFFSQGDRERELGITISLLCDRYSTMVAKSQLGFIEYVITPMFATMHLLFKEVNGPAVRNAILNRSKIEKAISAADGNIRSPNQVLKHRFSDASSSLPVLQNSAEVQNKLTAFDDMCVACITYNNRQWTKKERVETERELFGENAFTDAGAITLDLPPPLLREGFQELLNSVRSNIVMATDRESDTLNNGNHTEPP